jgi:uncharacterized membrane protein YbaN (DUF454 family)
MYKTDSYTQEVCYDYNMRELKKAVHIVLGLTLILIGLAGLVLPILNGTILLLIGLILLSFENVYVESHLQRIARKNTLLEKWYNKLSVWMRKHM